MSVYSFFFSPTGGTEKVAHALCSAWSSPELTYVDFSGPHSDLSSFRLQPEDLCFITSPVFEGRIPAEVLRRLHQMHAENTPAVFTVVYGNRHFNDALLELKDHLSSIGLFPIAGVTANAEHSILRIYGTGRPDADDLDDLSSFSKQIRTAIESEEPLTEASVPGKTPYIVIPSKTSIPDYDSEKCNHCGICLSRCPVQAISPDSITDPDICIRCMRCVSVCPTGARFISEKRVQAASERLGKWFAGRKPNRLYSTFSTLE